MIDYLEKHNKLLFLFTLRMSKKRIKFIQIFIIRRFNIMDDKDLGLVNLRTREILRSFNATDMPQITTKSQRDAINSYYKKEREKTSFELMQDNYLGSFIFSVYEKLRPLNHCEDILKPVELTRFILLATYINYNGLLSKGDNRTPLTKKDIQKVLGLSANKTHDYLTALIGLKFVEEYEGEYYINKKYFFKGCLKEHKQFIKDKEFTRIYIDTIRKLYKTTPKSKHGHLGLIYQLIPFINYEWNIVCHNPQERDTEKIIPFTINEIIELLGYNSQNLTRFKKNLYALEIGGVHKIFITIQCEYDYKSSLILVNPLAYYKGDSVQALEYLITLFNLNAKPKMN